MHNSIIAASCLIIGACAGSAITAVATAPPNIRKASEQVTKSPPHGKARVVELAAGSNAWLGLLELNAGAAVPSHQDSTEEFIHVTGGGGQITIDGITTTIAVGDTVYMPPDATVSFVNGQTEFRAIQVFAGPAPAAKYQSWAPLDPSKPASP